MKITTRNISRYKNRVLITIIGTAGCCFLIMLGFALRDSIRMVGTKQYSDILKYDNLIILNDNVDKMTTELKESFDGLIKEEDWINVDSYTSSVLEHNEYEVSIKVKNFNGYKFIYDNNSYIVNLLLSNNKENLELLKPLLDRRVVKIMIHEQYFYKDYFLDKYALQPDKKLLV